MTLRNVIFLLALLLVFSCENSQKNDVLKKSNWLIGKWERKSVDGNLTEIWRLLNDSTYVGESYFIKAKDTLHFENIQLQQNGNDLVYISNIKGQNNNQSITFMQNKDVENPLVFENIANEYPKKIAYSMISKERIMIQISGIQQGKQSSDRFILAKKKL